MNTDQHVMLTNLEISLPPLADRSAAWCDRHLHPFIASALGVAEDAVLTYAIRHRSVDARRKPDVRFIYTLDVTVPAAAPIREQANLRVHTPPPDQEHPLYHLPLRRPLPQAPIIVGTGPAGLMAAYLLALHGCQPLILERGFPVEQRQADIDAFLRTRELKPNSNYLYGEGGAGTYSDGKLYTRIKDDRMRFVLEAYVAARAPKRILYEHRPHIGSDILPYMVKRLRQQIEAWGGQFRWGATVTDVLVKDGQCQGVLLENGERLESPLTLIACGHSARELLQRIAERGVAHQVKDFQLGCRIEHPQELLDQAQYGGIPPRKLLGAAEYTMTSRPLPQRKLAPVTTFCMCPGGEIIPATSDAGQLCTNGMSRFLRNQPYGNAGLIVNQAASAFHSVHEAFNFLTQLERQAYRAGAADGQAYCSPAQGALAFTRGERGVPRDASSYRLGLVSTRLDLLLPLKTVQALQAAVQYFDTLIPGFLAEGLLIGVETRVSSPVRFERQPDTFASSLPGLYVAGEGAGFAGGIISSALDGLRLAETILTGIPATRKIAPPVRAPETEALDGSIA